MFAAGLIDFFVPWQRWKQRDKGEGEVPGRSHMPHPLQRLLGSPPRRGSSCVAVPSGLIEDSQAQRAQRAGASGGQRACQRLVLWMVTDCRARAVGAVLLVLWPPAK